MDQTGSIGRAYLHWLREFEAENGRITPPLGTDFLSSPASSIGGQQVSEDVLHRVMDWLCAHGVIRGIGTTKIHFPGRIQLTNAGEICLTDYDGDVRAWANSRRGGITNSVINSGHNAQIVSNSANVNQSQSNVQVDVAGLRNIAMIVQELLPHIGLPEAQRSATAQAVAGIIAEGDRPQPDHARLRAFGEQLKAWLPLASGMGQLGHRSLGRYPHRPELIRLVVSSVPRRAGPPGLVAVSAAGDLQFHGSAVVEVTPPRWVVPAPAWRLRLFRRERPTLG